MEKEKPYKCDVCGKRYKNLNGLKYVSIPKRSSLTILLTATAQTTLTALQSRNEAQWPPPSSRPQQYQRRHQRQRPRPPRHRRGRHALTSPRDEHNINTSSRNFGPKTASNGFSCIISLLGHSSCICAALQTRTHDTPRAAAPRSRAGDATIKVEALTLRPNGLFPPPHTRSAHPRRFLLRNSLLPRLDYNTGLPYQFGESANQKCSAFYTVH